MAAGSLDVDSAGADPDAFSDLLTSLVVPRPIAWVSSVSAAGTPNLAPHSFFTIVSSRPAMIAFSSIGVKDTLTNIKATGEFVVSLVNGDDAEAMIATSAKIDTDEFEWAHIPATPALRVAPPRVASARAHLECVLETVQAMGNGHLIVGRVIHVHVAETALRDGQVDVRKLDPIARLGGTMYSRIGETAIIDRPPETDLDQYRSRLGTGGAVRTTWSSE